MMYLGFMDSHKCISLVGDFEDEGGHADVKIKKKNSYYHLNLL